jgi:hypothetical protein
MLARSCLFILFLITLSLPARATLGPLSDLQPLAPRDESVPADIRFEDNTLFILMGTGAGLRRVALAQSLERQTTELTSSFKAWTSTGEPMVLLVFHREPQVVANAPTQYSPRAIAVTSDGEIHHLVLAYPELTASLSPEKILDGAEKKILEVMSKPELFKDLDAAITQKKSTPNVAYIGGTQDGFGWSCRMLLSKAGLNLTK